jgi:hypothetical protein
MKDVDNYHSREAKCPFYIRCSDMNRLYSIHCQGLIEEGGIIVWFRHRNDREIQFKAFCAGVKTYEKCEICRAIMEAGFADDA